jgi:hypothetical protein
VWWDAPFLVVALVFRLQRKKTQTKMESEKVYVHYQGHPEFTYIAKLDPLLTVAHLAQVCPLSMLHGFCRPSVDR